MLCRLSTLGRRDWVHKEEDLEENKLSLDKSVLVSLSYDQPLGNLFLWLCVCVCVSMCLCLHGCTIQCLSWAQQSTYPLRRIAAFMKLCKINQANVCVCCSRSYACPTSNLPWLSIPAAFLPMVIKLACLNSEWFLQWQHHSIWYL